jgi:hypothetical protein
MSPLAHVHDFALDAPLHASFRAYNSLLLLGFFGLLVVLGTALLAPGVQRNSAWITFYVSGASVAAGGTHARADAQDSDPVCGLVSAAVLRGRGPHVRARAGAVLHSGGDDVRRVPIVRASLRRGWVVQAERDLDSGTCAAMVLSMTVRLPTLSWSMADRAYRCGLACVGRMRTS